MEQTYWEQLASELSNQTSIKDEIIKKQQQEIERLNNLFKKDEHFQFEFKRRKELEGQLEEAQKEIKHWREIAESCECNN